MNRNNNGEFGIQRQKAVPMEKLWNIAKDLKQYCIHSHCKDKDISETNSWCQNNDQSIENAQTK